MEHIPYYIIIVFVLTTACTVAMFWKATSYSAKVIIAVLTWLLIQGLISSTLFYTYTGILPPRFLLLILPPFVVIGTMFLTTNGKAFMQRLSIGDLILMNSVRVPVEIVLYWLFVYKGIPQVMTFDGNNFDMISGITAPIAWLFFKQKKNVWFLLGWNVVCLVLLVNIVVTAMLAAPTPFQQIAFEQPNIAVLYFPFVWLPCCIVPLVLLSHLTMIRYCIQHIRGERRMSYQ